MLVFKSAIRQCRGRAKTNWLGNFKELAIGLEIFNLFNNQNAITNTWVRDAYSKMNMRFQLYDDTCF
jgi:hypothetical protein